MSDHALPLTFARLSEIQEHTRDVHVPQLGLVRLQLLDACDKLHIVTLLEEIERTPEGRIVHQRDTMRFSVALLGLAIVDAEGQQTFCSDAGRRALSRLPLSVLQELTTAAIELNGMGPAADGAPPAGVQSEIEAAKKN